MRSRIQVESSDSEGSQEKDGSKDSKKKNSRKSNKKLLKPPNQVENSGPEIIESKFAYFQRFALNALDDQQRTPLMVALQNWPDHHKA